MNEIQRPKVCSVSLEFRLKANYWSGHKYVCKWVAAHRGRIIAESEWFEDKYATAMNLRAKIAILLPSLPRQQRLIDETRETSAEYYWDLIDHLEKEGWQPIYNKDGEADSMVKTAIPKQEPMKPKPWR